MIGRIQYLKELARHMDKHVIKVITASADAVNQWFWNFSRKCLCRKEYRRTA